MSTQQGEIPVQSQLARAVRDWFHLPYAEMGYRAETRTWGTYWNIGMVHVRRFPKEQVGAFLEDVRAYYDFRPVYINLDNPRLEAELGPLLLAADCRLGKADFFLAHTGPLPAEPNIPDLILEPVDETNLRDCAAVSLRAFAEPGESFSEEAIEVEITRREAELAGSARGWLARIGPEAAGVAWYYREEVAYWINTLGVLEPYRRQGVGRRLMRQVLAEAYDQGRLSAIVNVLSDNQGAINLYRRLGFTDLVYRRQRYVLDA